MDDEDEATRAQMGEGAHTILAALESLTTVANTSRTVVSIAAPSSTLQSNQARLRLGGNTGSGRWQYYLSGSASVTLDLSPLRDTYDAGPYVVAARCAGAGGAIDVVDLIPSTPAVVASDTAPATLPTDQSLLTLGLQRYGDGAETAPLLGTVSLLLLAPVRLTDTQLALARAIMVTEGYL
jgi:hypothetical protein